MSYFNVTVYKINKTFNFLCASYSYIIILRSRTILITVTSRLMLFSSFSIELELVTASKKSINAVVTMIVRETDRETGRF